jgi:hypothetical protein
MAPPRRRDDDLVDVELVEHDDVDRSPVEERWDRATPGDDPAPGSEAVAASGTGSAAASRTLRTVRTGRRGRRAAAVLAVAGLLTFAVGANLLEVRREAAREAALADLPGMLRPLDGAVEVLWEVDGQYRGDLGELILVAGPRGLQGVDAVTGEVRWTRSAGIAGGAEESCMPIGRAAAEMYLAFGWRGSVPLPDPEVLADQPLLLACMTYSMAYAEDGAGVFGPVTISVIDGLSGATVNLYSDSGSLLNVEEVGADLVLTVALPDGHLRASRWDPVSGEQQWERTSQAPVFTPGSANASSWGRDGDVMTVTGVGSVGIDLETGEEVPADDTPSDTAWTDELPLPDGRTATWTYSATSISGSGAVVDEDGSVLYELPGPPWRPHPHDGSVPEVLVVHDEASASLFGLDAQTGEELWRGLLGSGQALVQVDGVGVVLQSPGLQAFDVRDGSLLWSAEADTSVFISGLTDGDVVLALRRDTETGGRHDLVALALEDGSLRWSTPMPAGLSTVYTTPAGRLVAISDSSVAALG